MKKSKMAKKTDLAKMKKDDMKQDKKKRKKAKKKAKK
jgi:hypothetical protein